MEIPRGPEQVEQIDHAFADLRIADLESQLTGDYETDTAFLLENLHSLFLGGTQIRKYVEALESFVQERVWDSSSSSQLSSSQ